VRVLGLQNHRRIRRDVQLQTDRLERAVEVGREDARSMKWLVVHQSREAIDLDFART